MSELPDNIGTCPKCGGLAEYWACPRCCDENHIEYMDAPEVWGEDSPSEVNHLVLCPDCRGRGGDWWCKKCGRVTNAMHAPEAPNAR